MLVYGLVLDDVVYYVGQTVYEPERRLRDHVHNVVGPAQRNKGWRLYVWMAEHLDDVKIVVIERNDAWSEEQLDEAEIKWIAYGRKHGWPLFNVHRGGRNDVLADEREQRKAAREQQVAQKRVRRYASGAQMIATRRGYPLLGKDGVTYYPKTTVHDSKSVI